MNRLPIQKKVQIINMLVEGNSLRATSRMADVSINTVTKLLVEVGQACEKFHAETVVNVNSKRVQCDKIWSFCYAKAKNVNDAMPEGAGDVWTWTSIDADNKLIVSWMVADRSPEAPRQFMQDLASRLKNRVQVPTDGFKAYLDAVYNAFDLDINYAQSIKMYGNEGDHADVKYSPAECTGTKKNWVTGEPDTKHISKRYVERQNLTMTMHMRRFTRLTIAFSKKIENYCHAIALHLVYYNFVKQQKTLRVTPAMAAGLTKRFMSIEDIVNLVPEPEAKKRGEHKNKKEQ